MGGGGEDSDCRGRGVWLVEPSCSFECFLVGQLEHKLHENMAVDSFVFPSMVTGITHSANIN